MKIIPITVEAVDAVLPQTQCGDCDFDGCKPYAEAIVNSNEPIDKCPPGGLTGLEKLSAITRIAITGAMREKILSDEKPLQVAKIRENECIGCKKCIDACPVDAILGAAKFMHSIITDECNGCELCIPPCPMDCIDLIKLAEHHAPSQAQSDHYRQRYESKTTREQARKLNKRKSYLHAKQKQDSAEKTLASRQAYIQAALKRKKT